MNATPHHSQDARIGERRLSRRSLTALVAGSIIAATCALGASAASAYMPQERVLVIGAKENARNGLASAATLRSLGYKVTLTVAPAASGEWKLPATLKKYSSIWSVTGSRPYTEEQLEQLERYVSTGGRLYLGAAPSTPEAGANPDQEIARAVLSNKQIGVKGGSGTSAVASFNPEALDGIAREPNTLLEIPQSDPGGISSVAFRNVLTHFSKFVTSVAFDEADMVSGRGRLVIYNDEWPASEPQPSVRNAFIENIQDFLEGNPGRVPRQSAQYVGLGDSYASGLGSFQYQPEAAGPKNCHRATNGYVAGIAADDNLSLAFDACSGSTIADLFERRASREPQLNDVGPNTTAVTLSIGGSDYGFSGIVEGCLQKHPLVKECHQALEPAVEAAGRWLESGREPGSYKLASGKHSKNAQYLPSLTETYESILDQAPRAELVVVGYPELFETATSGGRTAPPCRLGVTSSSGSEIYVTGDDVAWLNGRTQTLNAQIKRAVAAVQSATGREIRYADTSGTFVGSSSSFFGHGLCDAQTPWINSLLPEPGQSTKFQAESFYPNVEGQQALRELIETTAVGF